MSYEELQARTRLTRASRALLVKVELDVSARVGYAIDKTEGVEPLSHSIATRRERV